MELYSRKSSSTTIKFIHTTTTFWRNDKHLPQHTTVENNLAYISILMPDRSDEQSNGGTIVITMISSM
jgi:hypothetical protein